MLAACTMVVLALGMGYVLGWANQAFHVEVDPRVEAVNDALPGANCGGCGFVGCNEYAEAVVAGNAPVDKCAPGGVACAEAVADILGVDVEESFPSRAVVHCSADFDKRLNRREYRGEQTCGSANIISGVQGCAYGCLGLGDCEVPCLYDAIHMIDGLATIDYEKCVGCGACEKACPRHIISMVPFKADRMLVVACSNQDKAKDVKAVCKTGCIGCSACTRFAELLNMSGNAPAVDYEAYDPETADFEKALDKCPMESLTFVGKPSQEAAVAVGDAATADRIEADFQTTVDKTEWRG